MDCGWDRKDTEGEKEWKKTYQFVVSPANGLRVAPPSQLNTTSVEMAHRNHGIGAIELLRDQGLNRVGATNAQPAPIVPPAVPLIVDRGPAVGPIASADGIPLNAGGIDKGRPGLIDLRTIAHSSIRVVAHAV